MACGDRNQPLCFSSISGCSEGHSLSSFSESSELSHLGRGGDGLAVFLQGFMLDVFADMLKCVWSLSSFAFLFFC